AEIITRVMSGADASTTPDLKVTGDLIEADVYNSGHLLPDLIRSLDEKSIGIADLNVRRPTLDDVFLSLTGRSLRD
ncbi:MAG: ABC transporter, partial [Corynebacterium kroppenstedtii]|nr:ABC transporter [Corynebacterium kroppenstedtii]